MPFASYLTFFHSFFLSFLSFRSSPYEILLKATRVYKDKILYMVYETLEEVSVSQWTAQSHMITHYNGSGANVLFHQQTWAVEFELPSMPCSPAGAGGRCVWLL